MPQSNANVFMAPGSSGSVAVALLPRVTSVTQPVGRRRQYLVRVDAGIEVRGPGPPLLETT